MDHLEPVIQSGSNIVEYHGCDFFPKRWFQAVFVVTCQNTILYDRLKLRNYNEKKIESNIECEIFRVILEEAYESYDSNIVFELKNETKDDAENCIKSILSYCHSWKKK